MPHRVSSGLAIILAVAFARPLLVSADTLKLKDGRELTGTVIARRDGVIWFKHLKYSLPTTDAFTETEVQEVIIDKTTALLEDNEQPKPAVEPETAPKAAPDGAEDRALLFSALSDTYRVGSATVARRPNIDVVCQLAQSPDPVVADLAKKAAAFITIYESVYENLDSSDEVRKLRWEFLQYAVSSVDDSLSGSIRDAADAFGQQGGSFHSAIQKFRKAMQDGLQIQRMQNVLRESLKRAITKGDFERIAGRANRDPLCRWEQAWRTPHNGLTRLPRDHKSLKRASQACGNRFGR